MGVQVVAKGVNAEDYAVEYAAPIRRGLEGIFFTNTSLEKCAHNYAPGKKSGSVVGAPSVNGQYMSGRSSVNYVQTDIVETEEMTFFIIARALNLPSGNPIPAADQVILLGNYLAGPWSGVVMWCGTSTSLSTNAGYGVDEASNANLGAGVTPNDDTKWGLYCGRVKTSGPDTKNFTNGLTFARVATDPRRVSTGRPLRIGSGYQSNQTGTWDMAAAMIYNVALNDAERDVVVQDLRAYAARRGITV
jgi:hypothetical protein